jgi:prepilin-type N-terminal cleavage/methylation domain-containing protein
MFLNKLADLRLRRNILVRWQEADSFTLIELLIVIAIIGILAAAVVLVLNPQQMIAQGRDSTRLQDIKTLNSAIGEYLANGNTALGTANVVYVSVPDPTLASGATSTCASLGLPALPSGWIYNCVSTTTLQETNGSGWMPVNFHSISTGTPLPTLPIDPTNTTSSGEFYTYATNGTSYELTAHFESNNYQTYAASDGGPDPSAYEAGTSLTLTPFIHGMVAYWPLAEGTGLTAYDHSGWGNNGTLSATTDTPVWTANCFNAKTCLTFDGLDDYVNFGTPANFDNLNATFIAWINTTYTFSDMRIIVNQATSTHNFLMIMNSGNIVAATVQGSTTQWEQTQNTYNDGKWHMVAAVRNGDNAGNLQIYVDGQAVALTTNTGNSWSMSDTAKMGAKSSSQFFYGGEISKSYVFNTALTAAQIQAIYNAEKP